MRMRRISLETNESRLLKRSDRIKAYYLVSGAVEGLEYGDVKNLEDEVTIIPSEPSIIGLILE